MKVPAMGFPMSVIVANSLMLKPSLALSAATSDCWLNSGDWLNRKKTYLDTTQNQYIKSEGSQAMG
jgi:hypothetical protein